MVKSEKLCAKKRAKCIYSLCLLPCTDYADKMPYLRKGMQETCHSVRGARISKGCSNIWVCWKWALGSRNSKTTALGDVSVSTIAWQSFAKAMTASQSQNLELRRLFYPIKALVTVLRNAVASAVLAVCIPLFCYLVLLKFVVLFELC